MSETPLNNFRKKQVNLEAFLTEFLTIKKKNCTVTQKSGSFCYNFSAV